MVCGSRMTDGVAEKVGVGRSQGTLVDVCSGTERTVCVRSQSGVFWGRIGRRGVGCLMQVGDLRC